MSSDEDILHQSSGMPQPSFAEIMDMLDKLSPERKRYLDEVVDAVVGSGVSRDDDGATSRDELLDDETD